MQLIDQHTKAIMEGCKARARDVGLNFENETLEYVVSNRDLLELSPKGMIPTLYDYWVHDVEVLKEKGKYELYPGNPYETVINTRPAISYYNDNNPDWLNVMIFYHVIAHIDFFQNNLFFRHTWDYDFTGQALSDKRLIANLRAEKGRWVDYVIEFSRGIDNLAGYYALLSNVHQPTAQNRSRNLDFYFDIFLQDHLKVNISDYIKEIERYNDYQDKFGELGESTFFSDVEKKHPELKALFEKHLQDKAEHNPDIFLYLQKHSTRLAKEKNSWMKLVMQVVRNTSLFFQPQIRTKIMNEGWASYWHETLFLKDNRIKGHEIDFAKVNAGVTALPRVGLNPYALGMRLFYHIEELVDRGRNSFAFQSLQDSLAREAFDRKTRQGRDFIFRLRENYCDFTFINDFLNQDFIDRHKLLVAGKRLNKGKMVYEYYVKSRRAKDYRDMIFESLYHPPRIIVDPEYTTEKKLYLKHVFEGKPLVKEFIANTMLGIEYLWGGSVMLETNEAVAASKADTKVSAVGPTGQPKEETKKPAFKWQRVLYTMEKHRLTRRLL
jgi:stage V sporulation protein R